MHSPFKADIWTLGIVLYKLLTNRYPFEGKNDVQLYARINKCNYAVEKYFSQGVLFILNKMIRKDPAMRYTTEELMNDSWVISGPLITGRSYYSNADLKTILRTGLVSRNRTKNSQKRPGTTATSGFQHNKARRPIAVSTDKIPSNTQYQGFGNMRYRRTLDVDSEHTQKSVSINLPQREPTLRTKQSTLPVAEKDENQDKTPGVSYFRTSMREDLLGKQLPKPSLRERYKEDSYCMANMIGQAKPIPSKYSLKPTSRKNMRIAQASHRYKPNKTFTKVTSTSHPNFPPTYTEKLPTSDFGRTTVSVEREFSRSSGDFRKENVHHTLF